MARRACYTPSLCTVLHSSLVLMPMKSERLSMEANEHVHRQCGHSACADRGARSRTPFDRRTLAGRQRGGLRARLRRGPAAGLLLGVTRFAGRGALLTLL